VPAIFLGVDKFNLLRLVVMEPSSDGQCHTDEIRRTIFSVTAGPAPPPPPPNHRRPCHAITTWLDFIHVAGHQFDFCVLNVLPLLLFIRDPADQIHNIAFFG